MTYKGVCSEGMSTKGKNSRSAETVYLTVEEGQGYDNITGITYSSLNVLTAKVRSDHP